MLDPQYSEVTDYPKKDKTLPRGKKERWIGQILQREREIVSQFLPTLPTNNSCKRQKMERQIAKRKMGRSGRPAFLKK